VNKCSSCKTTFSSLASNCIVYASTKWHSSASSSFDSSMHTRSIDVTPSHVCSLARQHRLLLRKNLTTNVSVVSMSWIIVCTKYIFTLYIFPSAHSKDDDECSSNLTTNSWIFNIHLYSS
jgi:hypothetical protein